MKHTNAPRLTVSGKPYDIRQRTELFACDVVSIAQELHSRGPIAGRLSLQLVDAAVNAASNVEEADDGSSDRDFRAKDRIALRELKEARLRLRILRRSGYLRDRDDAAIQEATELVNIVATIVRNSEANAARRTANDVKRPKG